jgi:hypothetical protein
VLLAALGLGVAAGRSSSPAGKATSGWGKAAHVVQIKDALIYPSAVAVHPRIHCSVSPDSIPGRFRYRYTLFNDSSSTNTIHEFALDPIPKPLSVMPPLQWEWAYGFETEDQALYFESKPDSRPAPVGWDSLTVVRSIYDLAPGQSMTFGVVSDRPPAITQFFAQGYYQDSISSEGPSGPFYWPVSIWNNSVTGDVIGPDTTMARQKASRLK